jgi:hypothetical protein
MIDKLMQFELGVMDNVMTLENQQASRPSLVERIRATGS